MASRNTGIAEPIVSEFANDPDMQDLVVAFISVIPDRIARLRRAFDTADCEAVKRLAHQMRGAAGGYGFPSISAAAALLEKAAATSESLAALEAAIHELCDLCHRATAAAPEV